MIIVPAVAAEAYREASRNTLIISDSYLVFFNSKEYRIVSFKNFSGGCNNPCFLSVYRLKGTGFPGNALEETINKDQRGHKNEDRS